MSTLVLFCDGLEAPFFFVVEEDWSRFHGVYINSTDSDDNLQSELSSRVYDDTGRVKFKKLERIEKNPNGLTTVPWDIQITCGMLP